MHRLWAMLATLFVFAAGSRAVAGTSGVRYLSNFQGSVYAFVGQARDLEGAREFCRALEISGEDENGTRVTFSDFELDSIDSIQERDWLHKQIYRQPGGLNQYTWAGDARYRGTPRTPSGQALIFGVWNDPRGLQPWPDEWYSAFVCETASELEITKREPDRPSPPTRSAYNDDAMLYNNHLYVVAERGRTLEQAISYCNSLERRANGRAYPAFQMLRIESPEEQVRIHALIQSNGGAWTWAGKLSYQGGQAVVDGYGLVFTQWDRPDILTQQSAHNKYAVVCESVGD